MGQGNPYPRSFKNQLSRKISQPAIGIPGNSQHLHRGKVEQKVPVTYVPGMQDQIDIGKDPIHKPEGQLAAIFGLGQMRVSQTADLDGICYVRTLPHGDFLER